MGKGGGKCASRERSGSSVASRTPRLPAKPHNVTPHQSSAKAKDVDRAADTDSATLEPFIPKKMGSSQVEEDDDIDTNVMFDQQEIHSHVSDSGRRLLGSPSSAVQSAYNTAMPSPSRSFSSGGGRSPDAFHDAPDELQHFQASPNHPRHIKSSVGVSQQGGVIANTSQSSFDSTRPRFQDDDDLFPSKETIIPTSSNNSAVVHLGLRKRAIPFHATPSESKNVSSTWNTEAPIVGGSGEETSSPITIISQTSFGLPQPQLGVTPQPHEPSEQATNIEVATPPKQKVDMKEGVHTQESTMPRESGKLSDNWELVPRELGSGSSSPVLVTMSKSTKASEVDPTSQLEAMKTENFKNLKFKEKEIEDDSQQPTNEQEENMKSMASKPFLSEHVVEGLPKEKSDPRQLQDDQPFEEEADTVRSLGSDQSDDIETHSINGDGGGYVFLGSPQHEESHDIEKLKDDKDFNKGVPIETLEQIEQRGHVQELPHVPIEKEEEPKEAKPTFEEAAHSLGFPTNPPIEEIQKDAILEALVEIPPPTQGKEPKIEAPIEEPKTSIQEDEALIVVEQKEAPIETLDHIKKHVDVLEPLEVAFEKKDKPKEVGPHELEPSFEELRRSLDLPISHPIQETQHNVGVEASFESQDVSDVKEFQIEAPIIKPQIPHKSKIQGKEASTLEEPYVPSIQQPQDKDVKPTTIEDEDHTPIVKENTSAPTQIPNGRQKDNVVEAPFEVPIRKEVEPEAVEPSFQEVRRSLALPIPHPVEETQGDVALKALQEGQHAAKVEESKNDIPTMEPQIHTQIQAQEKEAPTLEEPYVPSTKQPQDEDDQPISIEDQEEIPIVKEKTTDPIQRLDKLPQDDDVHAPFEVPTEHKVEPKDVEPSLEEVPRSLDLPITHPIDETQADVEVEGLQEAQHVVEEEESKIDAPITEPQILPEIEPQDKEQPTLEEPYVPSTQQPQEEDVQPTSIADREEIPIVKEEMTDPIQKLDKLPQDDDVHAPLEVPTEHKVQPKDVEPSFEEVPRSLDLPITHPIHETQGDIGVKALQEGQHVVEEEESKIDAPITEPQILPDIEAQDKEEQPLEEPYVPSTQQPQEEDVQPTSIEDQEDIPIVKEEPTDPIQGLDNFAQDDDVHPPFEVPIEHRVEPKEVEPSFEEVPRSLDLPITHPIYETQADVGVEALQESQHVVEEEESKIQAPITEPQILPKIEAQDKEEPTLEEPYVPSTQQPQKEDVQPTSIEDEEEIPIVKEETIDPIQRLDKLPQDDDVHAPFEVPTEHGVETKDVDPSFQEVPRSLDIPITHPIDETHGDVGVEALQEGPHVVEEEESKIDAPITEPQILPEIEPQDKEEPTLEEPYVPSIEQSQDKNVQPTSIKEVEKTPIIKEEATDPIQRLDKLAQDDDVHPPFEVPIEHRVEPKEVEPSFEEVPRSLDLPITHPIDETQEDVGVEALQEGQHLVEEEESKIDAPITEPQILPDIQAQDKEEPTLQKPYVPSTQQPQVEDVQPTSLADQEEIPIVKEETTDPIQRLDKLPQDDDVHAPFEVQTEHKVEPKDVEPSFEEVPRSLDLPIPHPIYETQGDIGVRAMQEGQHVVEEEESKIDAPITEPKILPEIEAQDKEEPTLEEPYVPSIEQSQDEDVQPTSTKEEEKTPIVKEEATDPIQRLDKLAQDDDVHPPFEVPIEHRVEPKEVEPSFEEVPRSLDLPITHPIDETQGDVGVEALQEGQHVVKEEESKIDPPITEPQILPDIEAQDKEEPTLEGPYDPSTQQPQEEDVQPTSIQDQEEIPIVKEETTDPIQRLDKLPQDGDVHAPFEVPTEHKVEPKDVEPSFEEVPRSLDIQFTHFIEETQGDVGVEPLQEGPHVVEEEESKIDAPITEHQILPEIEAQDKEEPTLEEPYVPSIEQSQDEDDQPTSTEEEEKTPIVKEEATDPIQRLDQLAQDDDVHPPFEVPIEHRVEPKEVEPSFEEVPRSLDLPITHPIDETQEDAGVEALQEGQHVVEEEEFKIDAPITEPQILPDIEAQDKEGPTLEAPYVPSTQQPQEEDVPPTSIEDEEEIPVVKEKTTDPIQRLDMLPQDDDAHAPFEVPTEHQVEPKDVEPSFEEVPRSLHLPIPHPIYETPGNVGVEELQEAQHVLEEEESKIEAPITEPQILPDIEAQDKEEPTLQEPYVPSTQQPQEEDVKPNSIEDQEEIPIVKEETTDPIQRLDKPPQDEDVHAPFEVPTEHKVEPKDVEPSFEEVPRSLNLPIIHPIEEFQGDVGVEALQEGQHVVEEEESKIDAPITQPQILPDIEAQDKEEPTLEEPYVPLTQQPQEEDVQPTSIEDREEIPIVKEETTDPIQRLDKLPQDDDVHAPFEVLTEHKVEPKDVEPSFEEVPRSLDLPITHPIEETQGNVGVEALQEGQHVVEEEESKIDAPITEPQILPDIEAQDKEEPTLEEPNVPSTQQPQEEVVQPTSIEDQEEIPIVKEETTDPNQRLDKLPQDDDAHAPFEVPTEHQVEPKDVEPSFEEVPRSLLLLIPHPIYETPGDVGVEGLQEVQHVLEEEESKIDAPITEPQILPDIEAQDKEEPTLEEPYVPSSQQPQEQDVKPNSIEDQEEIPIVKEETTDPIQRLDKPPQDDDVHAPFEVPTEHKVEPKDVEPSFEEVPRSLDLPIPHPIYETQGNVGDEALEGGQHVVEEEELKIDAPITEPQILPEIEAQDKEEPTLEEPTLEEPYVPSTQQPQEEDVQPTYIEDQEEIPIVKVETTDPIQKLDKLPQDDDVHAPFEVPTEHKVEPKDVEPSFEELPRSLDHPIIHPIEETQGDVGVEALQEGQHVVEEEESKIDAPITEPQILPDIEAQDKEEPTLEEPNVPSTQQPQEEDVQPTSIEDREDIPIVKEETTDPIQRLDKLPQDGDVHAPFEVPTEHKVEPKDVEPSFEDVPRSLDLPITHPIYETQGDVGVEALQEGQHVVEEEESKIDAPITEPQILPDIEAQDKEEPTLEEPNVPSTQQPQEEVVQPTSIEDQEEIPIVKEETTDPNQRLDKLPQDDDAHAPFEVPTEHQVEPKDVEPNFEEVPRSLHLPIPHPIYETPGDVGVEGLQEAQHFLEEEESKIDVPITEPQILPDIEAQDKEEPTLEEPYVPSTQQPQEEDVKPNSIEDQEEIPIVKEETTDPIQRVDKAPQDEDVHAPFEVPTEHKVETKDVDASFQEVPRSLDLPVTHPIHETQGAVGVEALQEGQHVDEEEESKIDVPITEPQILPDIEAQEKEEPTLEEPYVPSTQQPQEEDVQPTSIQDQEEIPIVKEETTDPIQRLDRLAQDDDVHPPFEVPIEHRVEPKEVEPSFEEVPRSLGLPITHPIDETQADVGIEALQNGQHVIEEEESKIEAPIPESQILPKIEAQEKEEPTLEEPYVPSTHKPQKEDVQPTSIEDQEEIAIVKEETTDPIQRLDKLPQDDDDHAPFDAPRKHNVETKDVDPSFEEVPRSLDFPITHPIDETQGDVGVEALQEGPHVVEEEESKIDAPITEPQILPEIEAQDKEESIPEEPYVPSIEQSQDEDFQPTSTKKEEKTPIVKEEATDPIQRLDKLAQDDDVHPPFEVPIEHRVEPKEVEASFEEVPRSLDLPITHPIDETQEDVGVEALQEGQHVVEEEESKIDPPITEPQILPDIQAQDKEGPTLEEPYVPSTQQPQEEDVQPTSIEDHEEIPIVKEETADAIQRLDKLPQDADVHAPLEVPTKHKREPKDVEPSFEEVPGSLDLPITHPIDETQGDVGVEALQERQHVVEQEESKIDAPITEPQFLPEIEAQNKEEQPLEEPYVPSTQQPQEEDVQPTSIENQEEIPIFKEEPSHPIQGLDKLAQDDDVHPPFEVPIEKRVEPKEVEPSFEEVPTSLDPPIIHPIEETQGDAGVEAVQEGQHVIKENESKIDAPIVEPKILPEIEAQDKEEPTLEEPYVPSTQQPQGEDVQPTSIEDQEEIPIVKEETTNPIQGRDKLPLDDDVLAPFEVPTEHKVEPKDVEPSFEEVPRSLDLPITHPIEETQGHVGVEASQAGQNVVEEEEFKIDPPITEPQYVPYIEAQDKEEPTLEEPYVLSIEPTQDEDVQPTSNEEEEKTPIVKEEATDPIQRLDKLAQDDDVHPPFEVPIEHRVGLKEVEPSSEEVPTSLNLPIIHPIEETQGDVEVEALQEGQHVVEEEESKIDAPITEPQILPDIEAQEKEEPRLQEPYVPSTQQPQEEDFQPTSIENQEEIPIVKEETTDPIERLDKLPQYDHVHAPFEVATEHKVEPKDVEPSFEEVPRSLDHPITHPIDETQGDVGVKALQEGQHVVEEEESKLDAPIREPQILPEMEGQDKEEPTIEAPYAPSTQQPQEEHLQPTCIEDQEEIPIFKEETTDPIQRLDKLPQDDDVHAPFEVPTEHKVEPKDAEANFETVPRSLDLPITHPIEETQGDVGVEASQEGQHVVEEEESKIDAQITEPQILPGIEAQEKEEPRLEEPYVPSTQQPQEEDVQPTSIEDRDDIPIVKEETTDPNERLDKLPQHDDVHAPFEVPTKQKVETKDFEPSFEEVPRSLDLPITQPIEETRGHVGVEALQEGQYVVEEEESKIDVPITKPRILPETEPQDKEEQTLEEPYVPSIQQSQDEDFQPTSMQEEEKTPIAKEDGTDPIQRLNKLAQDDDVHPPFEVPIEHRVEPKEVEPSFEEVPTSLDLPIIQPIKEIQGDVRVEVLQEGQHVVEEEESKIDAPIVEPRILIENETQDKEEPTLEEPYVHSTQQPQEEDVQPTSIEDQEEIPIVKEETTDPIERLDKLPQYDHVHAPLEVPTEHKVEPKDVEPNFEQVPRSLDLPITRPIEETEGDVGVEALQEGQHVVEEEESKIDAPITEPQILREMEAQDKEEPTIEEPYVPSSQQPQEEHLQPTSLADQEEIPILKEETTDPIQKLDKLQQHDDVNAPFEVPTEHKVEPKDVEPSFEEVPRSLDLPITHPFEETQGDVGLEALQEGQHVVEEEESKIDAPITEPQILPYIEAQDKEEPTLEEPYFPSIEQSQDEDVQPTASEEEEKTPIAKEEATNPIQRLDKLAKDDDVHPPFQVPIEHSVDPKEVEPSFQEVPRSLDLPIIHPIEETQGDVGVETLQEGQHVVEEDESKIDAPITEPQILPDIQAQDKEEPTMEEPYVPSTQQPQEEDVQPTSLENQEEIPIVKEETTDPIQRLDKLPQDDDVHAPFEVPTEHKVEPKDVEPSFEEVPRSLDVPIPHPIYETQGDVGVKVLQESQHVVEEEESKIDAPITEPQILPDIQAQDKEEPTFQEPYVPSTQQPQEEDVQPTSLEDQEAIPIVNEETTDPIQRLDKLPQDDDVHAPFEVPKEQKVEPKDVEASFEEVPRSLDLPIHHPIEETQGDVGVEASQEGEHVVEEEESKIDAPIREPQILPEIEAQDKEEPTLEEPYVPFTQQPQEEDVQPTSIEDEEEIPIVEEETTDPIQRLDEFAEDHDLHPRFEVPIEHRVELKEVEPSFEEVPRSLDLPIIHPIEKTQGDVGVKALQEGEHVVEEEESEIDAPITEPQIPSEIEAQDKEEPTLEEPYVPSTQQPQEEDVRPTSIEDQEEIPIVKEETTEPIQRLEKLAQDDDVHPPFGVPMEHRVESKEVEPSFEEVPTSLVLPINHPIEETQGDVGVEELQEGQHVVEEEESKIDAPITEPHILPKIQAQEKIAPTFEEPYVPSTQQPQEEDVQPTSIDDKKEIPIVKEETTDHILRLDKLPQDDDVHAPFEVATEHKVEPKDVEASFEEVPRSLDLPITHPIEETQGDVGVEALQEGQHVVEEDESKIDAPITEPQILPENEPQDKEEPALEEPYVPSIEQSQDEDVQPTSIEEEEKTPIVKEETTDPIQRLDKLAQDDDVHPPFEVPIENRVELKEVEPSFEEVPTSLHGPIIHPIEETQGDVGVKALQEGQHVVEEEESKIDAPITEPQILPEIEAQDKEVPTLKEPYVPSTQQPQEEDVQPTSIEDQEEIPFVKEETTDPIQRLDKLAQDDDVHPPFEVPIEHRVEPKDVEPSLEELQTSLDVPIIQPIEETQGDFGVEALQEGQHVVEEEESKIDASITKPQILPEIEAQDKEEPTLEEPYVPSTQQPQEEDVQPTSIEDQEEILIVKEETTDPIQRLDKLAQDDDVHPPFEVPIEHRVEPKEVEPSFEEVPTSLDLPIIDPNEESQGDGRVEALQEGQHVVKEEESKIDAPITEPQILPEIEPQDKEEPTLEEPYVPSTQQPQEEDVQPTSIEDQEEIPIVKEQTTDPIQRLDKLPQDDDVHAPFEVPIEHRVEPKEVEPNFEEVPTSLDVQIIHPIEETQGDVGVEALPEGQHVVEEEESKIDAPITEPQILPELEAQHKEEPALEEPYVPSTQQPQEEDVQPTSIEDQEEIPIVKEETTDPIQRLDKLAQDDDVHPPFEVPIENRVEPNEVEPSFEKLATSLDLPIIDPIEETEGDVGVEALQECQHVVEEEESKIDAPITEAQILPEIEAQDKEKPTLQEPYVPSTQQPQVEDVQPTSIEDQEEIPIVKEKTTDPIQGLDKLPQDDDVHAPFEVPTEHKVEPKDVQPNFEEVPRSLDLPITHPIEETQGDVGVEASQQREHVVEEEESKIDAPITEPQILRDIEAQDKEEPTVEKPYVPSTQQPHEEDVQPTSIEDHEEIPIVNEETTDPIQRLDKLPQDDDVHAPFEVPTEHKVEPKDVQSSFEEVPRSLDLPITHPIEETQGDIGVEASRAGQHVIEEEVSKIDAPITEPQILPKVEAQDKEEPTLEEPYVPSIEQTQDEDVQPTSNEEEEKTPIVKEEGTDTIQGLDKLAQDDDVHPPFEVPIEHRIEPKEVEPKQGVKPEEVQSSFEKVPRSLELQINQPIEETQDDVGVETLVEGEYISKVKEPQIEAPTTEPQAQEFEAQEKEIPMLEEQHIPSTKESEMEDVKVASIEKEQETPLVKEDMSTPIQTLEEVLQHRDVEDPFDMPTEKEVETKEVEPSFKEVPSFLEPQISQPIKETQDHVEVEAPMQSQDVFEVVEPQIEAPITKPQVKESQAQNKEALILKEQHMPSIEELEVEDVAPVSIEEEEETPIVKEEKNTPIQTIDELPQHGDVEEPFEVPTKKEVEPKEVELGFEEVARSLELPLNRPIEETQEHVGVESPINPPIEETREDVEVEGFQSVEDAFPLENVPSILKQQATSVEGDNWRTWKRELEANAMDKLFAQENLTPKETKNGDILEGPWPGVGSALEESIVSTKDPCGNDEKEIIGAEEAETMENKVELDMQPPSKPVLEKDIIEDAKAKETMVVDNVEARESNETNATFEEQHHKHTFVPMEILTSKTKEVLSTLEEPQVHIVEEEKELVVKPNLEKEPQSNALDEALIRGHTNGEVALEWPTHDSLVKKVEVEPTLEEGTSQLIAIDETLISKVDEGIFQESQLVVPSVEEEKDIEGKHSMEKLGFIRLDEVLGEKIPIEESKEVEDIPKLVEPQIHITHEEKEVELLLEKSKELELRDSQRNTSESPSTSSATSKDQGTNLDESNKVQGEFDTPQVVDQTWEQLKSNWKNFKGRPDIHVTNKVRQAAREAKEKARKVVGLPWPPARLSTSTQNVEDERKVSAPIVETNFNPSEVVDEFVGTRRELTCEPNTLESKVNELVDHTNNFPTKIETIPTGELILYV
ncbi:unnamed protein product [Sphagnum troendelagicum]